MEAILTHKGGNPLYGAVKPFTRGYHKAMSRGKRDLKDYKMICLVRGRDLNIKISIMSLMLGITVQTLYKWSKNEKRRLGFPEDDGSVRWATMKEMYDSPARRRVHRLIKSGKAGPNRHKTQKAPQKTVQRMLILRHNGMNAEDVAKECHVSVQAVHAALRRWSGWSSVGCER